MLPTWTGLLMNMDLVLTCLPRCASSFKPEYVKEGSTAYVPAAVTKLWLILSRYRATK
jgi:hypothetical protein